MFKSAFVSAYVSDSQTLLTYKLGSRLSQKLRKENLDYKRNDCHYLRGFTHPNLVRDKETSGRICTLRMPESHHSYCYSTKLVPKQTQRRYVITTFRLVTFPRFLRLGGIQILIEQRRALVFESQLLGERILRPVPDVVNTEISCIFQCLDKIRLRVALWCGNEILPFNSFKVSFEKPNNGFYIIILRKGG